MITEFITLSIGFAIWMLLKPYIGIGGLLVGGIIAYYLRPLISAILQSKKENPKTDKKNENKDNNSNEGISK